MITVRPAIAVAIAAIALGCDTSDGALNANPDDAFDRWTLGPPTTRIGGIEAHGGAHLSGIRQVVPIGDDAVLIRDSRTAAVLQFDAKGTLIRQIGGPGMGPGEFRSLSGMGRIGDTLWVMDGSRRRTHFFEADGRYLFARPLPVKQVDLGKGASTTFRPDALILSGDMVGFLPVAELPPGAPHRPPSSRVGLLAFFDTMGVAHDTLSWLIQGLGQLQLDIPPAIYFPGPNHFDTTPIREVADDGSAVAIVERPIARDTVSARYAVVKWNSHGEQTLRVEIPFNPVPFPPAIIDSIFDDYAADMAKLGALSVAAAKGVLRDSFPAPQYFPSVSGVLIGSDGRIWVAREANVAPPVDARRYDVLDTAGVPVGVLMLDRPGRVVAATASAVWVVEVDADDVPTLLRYPIVRP